MLGFLINLPAVSYYEHGSFLTANHGHAATMGVFGMLAIALATFSMRNIAKPEFWKEKWMMTGFWGLNMGLMGMIAITLVPVGANAGHRELQQRLLVSEKLGIYQQPIIFKNRLLWLRVIPDSVFIFAAA